MDSATNVDGRLTLRDGRTLAWHERGVPGGVPVLRLQGTPGSRLSRYPKPEVWERLGVRVITADRPGFGASTRMPGRGLASVADDPGGSRRCRAALRASSGSRAGCPGFEELPRGTANVFGPVD
jgi:pimeloyl-ACP methyl ester carboxylesterase